MRRHCKAGIMGLLLGACALAPQVQATDAVVGPGRCSEAGFASALGVVDASGGGTITFDCGSATIVFTSYKQIANAVTIDGGDQVTFDGNNASAFFQVFASAMVTLRRLTLQHGTFNASHALENFGSLTLDHVQVVNNASSDSVIANSGQLRIVSSVLADNTISAVLSSDAGDVLVSDSNFERNRRGSASATTAVVENLGGTLGIQRSTFSANEGLDGGALFIGDGSGAVRISQGTFTDNRAVYGAGIENRGTELDITDSTFSGNQASGDGGAIWSLQGAVYVSRSQFLSNSAGTTGGAISCYGDFMNVSESAFGANESAADGGAIFSTCIFVAFNSTFNANQATGAGSLGGAIYQNNGEHDSQVAFVTIAGNAAAAGGGIYNDGGGGHALYVFDSLLGANSGGNCAGLLASGDYNLSDDTHCGGAFTGAGDLNNVPLALQAFGDHGGPTSTMPPQAGNPAIDHVPLASCGFPVDQRGAARPAGAACDSGAFEVGGRIDAIFTDGFEVP